MSCWATIFSRGDRQTSLIAAKLNVVDRDFRRYADEDIVTVFLGGGHVGIGGLDGPPGSAEHVEFPTRVEPGLKEILAAVAGGLGFLEFLVDDRGGDLLQDILRQAGGGDRLASAQRTGDGVDRRVAHLRTEPGFRLRLGARIVAAAAVAIGAPDADLRPEIRRDRSPCRPRFAHAGRGHAQIEIGRGRPGQQGLQQRVVQ